MRRHENVQLKGELKQNTPTRKRRVTDHKFPHKGHWLIMARDPVRRIINALNYFPIES